MLNFWHRNRCVEPKWRISWIALLVWGQAFRTLQGTALKGYARKQCCTYGEATGAVSPGADLGRGQDRKKIAAVAAAQSHQQQHLKVAPMCGSCTRCLATLLHLCKHKQITCGRNIIYYTSFEKHSFQQMKRHRKGILFTVKTKQNRIIKIPRCSVPSNTFLLFLSWICVPCFYIWNGQGQRE